MRITFRLVSSAAWVPDLDGLLPREENPEVLSGRLNILAPDAAGQPPVAAVPMMLRRRLSPLGRMAAAVALALGLEDFSGQPLVCSSRYGDSALTCNLLQDLFRGEPVSPAAFGMSVHNGIAGLLSILAKNRAAHSSLAGGPASFCYGLLEALLQSLEPPAGQAPGQDVVFLHYDAPLPTFYEGESDPSVPRLALGLRLRALAEDGRDAARDRPDPGAALYTFGRTTRWTSTSAADTPATDPRGTDAASGFVHLLSGRKDRWHWSEPSFPSAPPYLPAPYLPANEDHTHGDGNALFWWCQRGRISD